MNIDMAALHAIVVERGISFDDLLEDVKAAVLSAYRHTEGHQPDAHIDIDRKSGSVRVLARELDEDGKVVNEWEGTPGGCRPHRRHDRTTGDAAAAPGRRERTDLRRVLHP